MAGRLVQVDLGEVGRVDVLVALLALQAEDLPLQQAAHRGALGQPERQAGADLVAEHEQFQLLAEAAMVAPLGVLEPLEIGVELVLRVCQAVP